MTRAIEPLPGGEPHQAHRRSRAMPGTRGCGRTLQEHDDGMATHLAGRLRAVGSHELARFVDLETERRHRMARRSSKWKPRRKVAIAGVGGAIAAVLVRWGVDPETAQDYALILAPFIPVVLAYIAPGEKLAQPPDSVPPPADPKDATSA